VAQLVRPMGSLSAALQKGCQRLIMRLHQLVRQDASEWAQFRDRELLQEVSGLAATLSGLRSSLVAFILALCRQTSNASTHTVEHIAHLLNSCDGREHCAAYLHHMIDDVQPKPRYPSLLSHLHVLGDASVHCLRASQACKRFEASATHGVAEFDDTCIASLELELDDQLEAVSLRWLKCQQLEELPFALLDRHIEIVVDLCEASGCANQLCHLWAPRDQLGGGHTITQPERRRRGSPLTARYKEDSLSASPATRDVASSEGIKRRRVEPSISSHPRDVQLISPARQATAPTPAVEHGRSVEQVVCMVGKAADQCQLALRVLANETHPRVPRQEQAELDNIMDDYTSCANCVQHRAQTAPTKQAQIVIYVRFCEVIISTLSKVLGIFAAVQGSSPYTEAHSHQLISSLEDAHTAQYSLLSYLLQLADYTATAPQNSFTREVHALVQEILSTDNGRGIVAP
jgi:hypothetical protein